MPVNPSSASTNRRRKMVLIRKKFFLALAILSLVLGAAVLNLLPVSEASATGMRMTEVADQTALINFKTLSQAQPIQSGQQNRPKPPPFKPKPTGKKPVPPEAIPTGPRPVTPVQPAPGSGQPSPAPVVSFPALGDNNTVIPPDTHGAVGPNHVMTSLNSEVRIQDRVGNVISTVSLDTFWASVAPGGGVFDPKLLYEPFNNRWIFTAGVDAFSANSGVLLAVSLTSDPTANWKLYRVKADPSGQTWADYPSIGFNKNWIVVQFNMFNVAGTGAYSRANIYVFDKADVYAFGAGNYKVLSDASGFVMVPAITYDNTINTLYLLEDWNGDFNGDGYLRLSTITGTVANPVLTSGVAFPQASGMTWDYFGPTTNFAPQAGTALRIETNDSRLQNVIYRNGTLWTTQTVFLPPFFVNRASVQWWQINPVGGAVNQFGRIDDPNGVNFYAYPTIAVNQNNDVLIGYSHFSPNIFAEADYSFRYAADPLNTLRDPVLLKAGEAPYYKDFGGFGENRWGDYSNTVVDPVNDTDLWTIQEYAATPSGGFDRWGTWWVKISPTLACNPLQVTSGTDSLSCGSLRAAINQANTLISGQDVTISFTTPVITLNSPLPAFVNNGPYTLRVWGGCSLQNVNGVLRGVPGTTLYKSGNFQSVGLSLTNRIELDGLQFSGFTDFAVDIAGNSNQVKCSWIGVTPPGVAATNAGGVRIAGINNSIGVVGQTQSGNLILSNNSNAILVVSGNSPAQPNRGYYNWLNYNSDGTPVVGSRAGAALKVLPGGHFKLLKGNRAHG
jgi:hypothetical protein